MDSIYSFLESAPVAGFIRQRESVHRKRGAAERFFSEYGEQIRQTRFSGRQLPAEVAAYASLDQVDRLAKQVDGLHAEIDREEQRIQEYEGEIAAIREKAKKQRQLIVGIALGILLLAFVVYIMSR
ncbi:MAG: hypothetical protein ACLTSL_01260 [Odoribacter splanchnicus]